METPAGTILFKVHHDLESITLDKEVMHLKEFFSPMIAKLIYNGMWFSPEMEFLMAAINKSQENVSGSVYITLYKRKCNNHWERIQLFPIRSGNIKHV